MVQSIDKRQTALCTLMHVADDQQFREHANSSIDTHLPLPEIALNCCTLATKGNPTKEEAR
jgi:hypothetical protein